MNTLEELIDAYLDNSFEHLYYLDLLTGDVIFEVDSALSGEPVIDWDEEENETRYLEVPKISSQEAFEIMEAFANQATDPEAQSKLHTALQMRKPFRNFKDTVSEIGLRDKWFAFENHYVEDKVKAWLEEWSIDLEKLGESKRA